MILFQVNILDAAKMSWVKDPFWTTHPFIYQKLMILLKSTFTMCQVKWSEVTGSCPTLCDPMDCSLSGSSLHGILQARVLEWVAISFSRGSSQLRDRTWVSLIKGRCFNLWATTEAPQLCAKYWTKKHETVPATKGRQSDK